MYHTLRTLVDAPSAPLYPFTQLPRTTTNIPLQLIPGGDKAQVLFRLSELKEIKKGFRKLHIKPGSVHPRIQRSQPKF
jgi:hypothetical protein